MGDDGAQDTHRYVPVLMYHDVAVTPNRADDPFTVSAALFSEHLAALRDFGWKTELVGDIPSHPADATNRTTYLTFDDAFESFGDVVAPTVGSFDAKATVFAPTAYLGRKAEWPWGGDSARNTVMSLGALRDLDPTRIEIGAHGHRHLQSDLVSTPVLRTEFRQSRDILEQGLERSIVSMAYPFGYHGRRARRIAREAGYTRACEVGVGLHPVGQGRDLFIRRLLITPDITPEGLLHLMETGQRSTWRSAIYSAGRPVWRQVRRIRGVFQRESVSDEPIANESL
jgi:peptidoglycan/xylan/chitin deacetylase (PgdA/CDA1 family)